MTGMRVLDIGAAEGFFSFEAERRGAREVVAIDSIPAHVRRFNICRSALASKATSFLCSVYDLNPRAFGTFDLVLFFGVLYHLRNPLLALERILSISTGTLLLQSATYEVSGQKEIPLARFHPLGLESDRTVFWMPNAECVRGMVAHAGFQDIETISTDPTISIAVRARSPIQAKGEVPDRTKAPWS
jgi:tRNA (mo5U34)-methyltransferase